MDEAILKKHLQKIENYMGVLSEQHTHEIQAVTEMVQFLDEKMERKFDKLDDRMDSMETKMDSMESKLDATFEETGKISVDSSEIKIKLDVLTKDLQKTKETFELFGQKTDVIENLQNRVQKLEQAFSK